MGTFSWTDPYPAPTVEIHEGIHVVRDDRLTSADGVSVGTKVRGLDYLIGHSPEHAHVKEWVFGSCPATGYAQISLPYVCERYQKRAVLFMAARRMDKLHEYQQRGLALGGDYRWVPSGMLAVTAARARAYAAEDTSTRMVLPIGLEHPTVLESFRRVALSLHVTPAYVWSVGSSGTLNRALQEAWPEAEAHVVEVGHAMSARERGRAIVHRTAYRFDRRVRACDQPPFPSVQEYDAKAWAPLLQWQRETQPTGTVLFWNVGA